MRVVRSLNWKLERLHSLSLCSPFPKGVCLPLFHSGVSARRGQLGRDGRSELHPGEEAAVAPEEEQQPGHGHGGQRDQEVRNQGFIEEMTLINTHLILNYMLL